MFDTCPGPVITTGSSSTWILQTFCVSCTAAGAGKCAGRYRMDVSLSFGSTTVWQSVIERVSVSQPDER